MTWTTYSYCFSNCFSEWKVKILLIFIEENASLGLREEESFWFWGLKIPLVFLQLNEKNSNFGNGKMKQLFLPPPWLTFTSQNMNDVSVDSNLHFSLVYFIFGQCCLNYLRARWNLIFAKLLLLLKSNFWRLQNSATSLGYLSKETVAYYIIASCRHIGTWGGMKGMFLPCTVWTSFELHHWKIYSSIFLQNQSVSNSRD